MPETHSSEVSESHLHRFIYPISSVTNAILLTGIMNPLDKALYRSTTLNHPLLLRSNFANPYKGALPSLFQKMAFGSTYYIFQGMMRNNGEEYFKEQCRLGKTSIAFINGVVAGTGNAIISNPISAIKYQSWNPHMGGFIKTAILMGKKGGFEPFFRGTTDGIGRDTLSCAGYEVLRSILRARFVNSSDNEKVGFNMGFFCDMAGAGMGTILGGAFNFSRNEKFKTLPELKPSKTKAILQKVWQDVERRPLRLFDRFNVGWGTCLTAVKMASTQLIYDGVRSVLTEKEVQPTAVTLRRKI